MIPWFVEHHNFRSEPKKLTLETIKQFVVNKRLFDSHMNPTGKGITNLFNKQDVPNGKVVIDKSTGLMWEDSKVERFIHYSNAKDHVVKLNKEKWAGFQNWRLPTIEEAYSILEPTARKIDRYSLHLDPELGESYPFIWTSDINPDMMEPWVLSYLTGDIIVGVTNNITREYKFAVRAIRLIH